MNSIAAFFDGAVALGSAVVLPAILFIIAIMVGVKFMPALRSSLSVGFILYGISLIIARFSTLLSEMGTMLIERFEVTAFITDAGRKSTMLITAMSKTGMYIIMLAIAINLILLICRVCRTINLDIWSLWVTAFAGAMVESLTGELYMGLIVASTMYIFTLIVSDTAYKGVEKYCGLPGATLANSVSASFAPFAKLVCWLLDLIPTKGRRDITLGWLKKKIGYLADPAFLSTVFTIIMGLVCRISFSSTLQMAVQVGALVFIMPKLMLVLGESIRPIAAGLADVSERKFSLRGNLHLGLPATCGLGNPTAMLLSLIMVPVTILLAKLMPNVLYVPTVDFYMMPYVIILIVTVCHGGLIRSFVSSVVAVTAMLYSSSALAGLFTQALVAADYNTYSTLGLQSAMYGATPATWILVKIASFGIAGIGLLAVVVFAMITWNYNRHTGKVKIYVKRQMELRASSIDEMKEQTLKNKELRTTTVSRKRETLRAAVEVDKAVREVDSTAAGVEQISIFTTKSEKQSNNKQ